MKVMLFIVNACALCSLVLNLIGRHTDETTLLIVVLAIYVNTLWSHKE